VPPPKLAGGEELSQFETFPAMTQGARRKEIGHGENADGRAGPCTPALAVVVVEAHERIQYGRQEVSVNHQPLPSGQTAPVHAQAGVARTHRHE
jgi:hypothetical protein